MPPYPALVELRHSGNKGSISDRIGSVNGRCRRKQYNQRFVAGRRLSILRLEFYRYLFGFICLLSGLLQTVVGENKINR